ncbi:glycosyltransferase family 4 protein [Candidatus Enterovibrio altilux]|uniref:Glycosyltransferase SypI n=1 Tax=Candidatus Enterovibrio altilux TaxID=1927128 RepID=A0A291B7N8_9GAMM|nr:glycosyltransferase family 4 protein [Candidatus Enterovibrio luxaltus]ATF09039.1 Glycosyltransferase SypI [Candidatus Enterovibrio luxaltus]
MTSVNFLLSTSHNVLFVHYGDNWIRGSERCLIDLLTHINKDIFTPVLWCNSDMLAFAVRKLNIRVYVSEFTLLFGEQTPQYNFTGYKKSIHQGLDIVDHHQIDLIHSNSGAPSQWLNLVARARKLPLVLHLHARYPLRDRITLGLHHASMAVGVSQPVVDQLLNDGVKKTRCQVIPNGIDTVTLLAQSIIDLRKMLSLPSEAFIAVSICSLITRKGVDLLIEACRQLRGLYLPIHMVIIGDGPERANLEMQIHRAHLKNYVHLIGEQHHVVGLMRGGADIFVSGAREEVFGLTLAEAGLARLPVVAPNVGGIPTVINHNHTGLLVRTENPRAIAQAIYYLFSNRKERIKMGDNGARHVMKYFTISSHTAKFELLYSTLIMDPTMPVKWLSHWQILPPLQASLKFIKQYKWMSSSMNSLTSYNEVL